MFGFFTEKVRIKQIQSFKELELVYNLQMC